MSGYEATGVGDGLDAAIMRWVQAVLTEFVLWVQQRPDAMGGMLDLHLVNAAFAGVQVDRGQVAAAARRLARLAATFPFEGAEELSMVFDMQADAFAQGDMSLIWGQLHD